MGKSFRYTHFDPIELTEPSIQGNRWDHRVSSSGDHGYHYSNKSILRSTFDYFSVFADAPFLRDGSYYYQNSDGSRYYNSGTGYSRYTSSSGNTTSRYNTGK